jgi:hypothetical protein
VAGDRQLSFPVVARPDGGVSALDGSSLWLPEPVGVAAEADSSLDIGVARPRVGGCEVLGSRPPVYADGRHAAGARGGSPSACHADDPLSRAVSDSPSRPGCHADAPVPRAGSSRAGRCHADAAPRAAAASPSRPGCHADAPPSRASCASSPDESLPRANSDSPSRAGCCHVDVLAWSAPSRDSGVFRSGSVPEDHVAGGASVSPVDGRQAAGVLSRLAGRQVVSGSGAVRGSGVAQRDVGGVERGRYSFSASGSAYASAAAGHGSS